MKTMYLLIIAMSVFLVACDGTGLPGPGDATEATQTVDGAEASRGIDAGVTETPCTSWGRVSVCPDGTNCPSKVPFCPPEGCAICQNDGTGCTKPAVCRVLAPPSGVTSPGVYAPPSGMNCAAIKSILQDGSPMDAGTFAIQCSSSPGSSFISVNPHSGNPAEMTFEACE